MKIFLSDKSLPVRMFLVLQITGFPVDLLLFISILLLFHPLIFLEPTCFFNYKLQSDVAI